MQNDTEQTGNTKLPIGRKMPVGNSVFLIRHYLGQNFQKSLILFWQHKTKKEILLLLAKDTVQKCRQNNIKGVL